MKITAKKMVTILLTLAFFTSSYAQTMTKTQDENATNSNGKLIKDLDGDGVLDSVYIEDSRIICRLSTQNFEKMQSQEVDIFDGSHIENAKNGFYFNINFMRGGHQNQFKYDNKTKRIQLIGMSRYQLGNAANDGSGESSVNLLTNDYIGDWNYFDHNKTVLIKIPTIKTKMALGKVYLEDFSEETYFGFAKKCEELYHTRKQREMQK